MSLLRKASIVTTPTAYENGKILSVKPVPSLGSELITNGGFDTDSDWTKQTGWTIANGVATCDGTNLTQLYQTNVLTQNKTYKVTYSITSCTSGGVFAKLGNNTIGVTNSTVGTYTEYFNFTETNLSFHFRSSNFIGSIDNVSVKEAIDADFDFTRNSSATRVNSQGLIEDVQILSSNLVSNGDFSQEGVQLVTNGDFSNGSNWNIGTNWSIENGKATSLGSNFSASVYQNISSQTNKIYRVEIEVSDYVSGTLRVVNRGNFVELPQSNGVHIVYLNTSSSSDNFLYLEARPFTGSIDNVSVKEVGQDWDLSADSSIFQGFANVSSTGTYQYILQSGILTVGKKYKVEYTILNGSTGTLKLGTSLGVNSIISTVGTHSVIANALTTDFYIERLTVCDVNITNISVIEITDDTNLPRIDYTGGEGHWLFEPQSTNLIPYSEDFSQWIASGCTVGNSSSVVSPSNSNNIGIITGTIGTVAKFARINVITSSSILTYSAFFKYNSHQWVQFASGGTSEYANFDIQNGVVGNKLSGTTSTIDNFGNGWYRCTLSTSVASTPSNMAVVLIDTANSSRLEATSSVGSAYIWGAQVEASSFATSYIPTEGSIKTRLQDAAFGAGSSDLINSTEGTLYVNYKIVNQVASFPGVQITDDLLQNQIAFYTYNNVLTYYVKSNNINTILNTEAVSENTDYKLAISYSYLETSLYLNGEKKASYLNKDMPLDLRKIKINQGGNVSKYKCLAVFKEALNNDELECLTGEGYETFNALALANNYTII